MAPGGTENAMLRHDIYRHKQQIAQLFPVSRRFQIIVAAKGDVRINIGALAGKPLPYITTFIERW